MHSLLNHVFFKQKKEIEREKKERQHRKRRKKYTISYILIAVGYEKEMLSFE